MDDTSPESGSSLEAAARELVVSACLPFRGPGVWGFLPVDDQLRAPVTAVTRVVNSLRAQFSDDVLLRAGIIEPGAQEGRRLASSLRHRTGAIVTLRDETGAPPFELLTAKGLLGNDRRPLLSALSDERTRRRAAEMGVLLAAGTIQQVAILIANGLPATLGTGLHRLSLEELRLLDEICGEGVPQIESDLDQDVEQSQAVDDFDPLRPVALLVDWDVAALSNKRQHWVRSAAARLAEARRHARLNLGGVAVWRPSEDDLGDLRFAVRSEDVGLVRAVLLNSLDHVVDFEAVLAESKMDPPSARRNGADAAGLLLDWQCEWRDHGLRDPDVESVEPARLDVVDQELLMPLLESALARKDPVVRNTIVLIADVARLLFLLGPQVNDTLQRSLANAVPLDASQVTLSQYLSFVDRFARLCGELRAWTH
jgi:hypothetical protein